jgi:hypothetical protein
VEDEARRLGVPFHAISAASGEGVRGLLEAAWPLVQEATQREAQTGAAADGMNQDTREDRSFS